MRALSPLALLALFACAGGGDDTEDTGVIAAVCDAGDTQAGLTACGLNDRGLLDEECVDGQWADSSVCDDPDECTDDATDIEGCWDDLGTRDVLCETGAWAASSDCLLDDIIAASTATDGTQADDGSTTPDISGDGQIVVFESRATNLVAGDANAVIDVFRHDLATGETTLLSAATTGGSGNGPSLWPAVSGDGRYTVFASRATDLMASDANGDNHDVFRYDADAGTLELVSVNSDEVQIDGPSASSPSISADGNLVAFAAQGSNVPVDGAGNYHVYLRDMSAGTTTRISGAGGIEPSISANGRYIAFRVGGFSGGRAIVPTTLAQAFVYDTQDQSTTQVSVDGTGADGDGDSYVQGVTDDGDVVFYSQATNLVAGDVNGRNDLFLFDKSAGTLSLESVSTAGEAANDHVFDADITPDGSLIAFRAGGTSLSTDVSSWRDNLYLRDVAAETTTALTHDAHDGGGYSPAFSADGRHLAFVDGTSGLASGDTNSTSDIVVMPLP